MCIKRGGFILYSHNHQKKIAVINDFTGFGRCSLSVSIPIISYMGIQCCPLPTSVFSNHTGFPEFYFDDYTRHMEEYASYWKKLDLRFNGILTGFLGSSLQIDMVKQFFYNFKTEETQIIIDPVMGDNGQLYPTYTEEMQHKMKELATYADVLTPNLTEACFLTDTPYHDGAWSRKELSILMEKLVELTFTAGDDEYFRGSHRAGYIVISGIPMKKSIGNVIYEKGKDLYFYITRRAGCERSGTGDVFSSIIAADRVKEVDFGESVKKASRFVKECVIASERLDIPRTDGVCFEEVLARKRRII